MSLTIELPPDLETWLEEAATREGVSKSQFAVSLIQNGRNNPYQMPLEELSMRRFESREFLVAYAKRGSEALAQMTPEERATGDAEDIDFLNALNENRLRGGDVRML